MKIVNGYLIKFVKNKRFDVVIHGCNCFCTMGAGIAKSIKENFPEVYKVDCSTGKGDKSKLGSFSWVELSNGIKIINAYTQYDFHGRHNVDYTAIRKSFRSIVTKFGCNSYTFAYPKIGAGLAGGDWSIISRIIDEELNGEDHTLVEYSKN